MSTIRIASGIIGTIIVVCLGIGGASLQPSPSATALDITALEASDTPCATTEREQSAETTDPPGEAAPTAPTATDDATAESGGTAPAALQASSAPSAPSAESGQGAAASPPASSGSEQGGSAPTPVAPRPTVTHVCSWTPVTEQVWVVDKAAWDEPRYTTVEHTVCSVCFLDLTEAKVDVIAHGKAHVLAGEGGGTHSEGVKVQTGTIHHDATGHYEQKTTGYTCKGCGAQR